MFVEYENLNLYNLEFKNIISGPAQVGTILNYTKLIGSSVIYHKKGNRDKTLKNNIAYAWTTEFMAGLGISYYIEKPNEKLHQLFLTDSGKELYDMLVGSPTFDENSRVNECKRQLLEFSLPAYRKFEQIFKSSVIAKNLCKYIKNCGTNEFKDSDFKENFFATFLKYYTGEDYIRNTDGSATTAGNRVPSTIQLCEFFDCVSYIQKDGIKYIVFDYDKLHLNDDENEFIEINDKVLKKLKNEDDINEKSVQYLIETYGIDGTVVREVVTRNSSVQDIFRHNLIAKYGRECAICGKKLDEVLIASHIQPAAESNVVDKANCENGLLLCALHDKLFDRNIISFDFINGSLLYSDDIKEVLNDYQLDPDFSLDERYMTDERKGFLMKHNLKFYERNE